MTNAIDKLMVNIGFKKSDIAQTRHRGVLYVGIALMMGLVIAGVYLNLS